MKRISLILLLLMTACIAEIAVAQSDTPIPPPQAKFYETLGKSYDEAIWRIMRGFIDELSIVPGARGHIISYGSKRQIDFFQRIVRARMKQVKFDTSRIKLIKGGKKLAPEHQFWIVPLGATVVRVRK